MKEKLKKFYLKLFIPAIIFIFLGWGSIGHRIINRNITPSLPSIMSFLNWTDSLAAHASDADNRKGSDPNEAPKHFIDIDNYPSFVNNGRIIQDYDSIVAVFGNTFVIDQGILPWAIITAYDSVKANFQRNDYHRAMLFAADLGHYVADSHMPLHITKNYNGQLTGQTGVHSRYETNLISTYQNQITYSYDSAVYVDNVEEYVFNFLYGNYNYVDSVLYADSVAKAFAGSYNTTYYTKLWELSKNYTINLYKNASYRLACLIYTAYLDGNLVPVELTSFTAVRNNEKISLDWSTATELNNYGFEIQKEVNDVWENIGFVKGNGTTTEKHFYNFIDENTASSTIFYRLKQIDIDGSVNFSNEVEVNGIPAEFTLEQNFPNPFNPSTTINFNLSNSTYIKLNIYNSNGELLTTLLEGYQGEGNHSIKFDASNLSSGIYFYKLEAGSFSQTHKMLLLK